MVKLFVSLIKKGKMTLNEVPVKWRESVRKELERCKEISDKRQTAKQLMKDLEKFAPPSKIDAR